MEFDWGETASIGSEGYVQNQPRKFIDEPLVFVTHGDKEFFEGIKNSKIVTSVFFDGQCTEWDLILDALRENQNITGCSFTVMIEPNNALKAIAQYLSFSKAKAFILRVFPDQEPIDENLYQLLADAIKSNKYIADISIGGTSVVMEEIILESLKAHPTIQLLQVASQSAGSIERVIKFLAEAPNINTLRLLGTASEDVADQVINLTRVSKNLTRLHFEEGYLYASQLIEIFNAMVKDNCQLKGLYFDMCYLSGREKEVGRFLAANLPLESLVLRSASIGTSDKELAKYVAEGLAQNTHLKELDLRENSAIDAVLPVLKTHRSITSIDFRGNSATKETIEQLADVLKCNDVLRVLRFTYSSVNPILHSLKTNQTLIELNVDQYAIMDENIKQSCNLDQLKEMLESNHSLTSLKLYEDSIQSQDIKNAIQNETKPFTERNKLEQRLNVTNTLQTIAMIMKSRSFNEKLPREIWKHIYSFVRYPGVVMDFCGRM